MHPGLGTPPPGAEALHSHHEPQEFQRAEPRLRCTALLRPGSSEGAPPLTAPDRPRRPRNGRSEPTAREAEPTKPLGAELPPAPPPRTLQQSPQGCDCPGCHTPPLVALLRRSPAAPRATSVSNSAAGARPSNASRCQARQPLQSKASFRPTPSRCQLLLRTGNCAGARCGSGYGTRAGGRSKAHRTGTSPQLLLVLLVHLLSKAPCRAFGPDIGCQLWNTDHISARNKAKHNADSQQGIWV